MTEKSIEHIKWVDGTLRLLDQRLLPHEIAYKICKKHSEVEEAIRGMYVRGAPAIGISAAYGMALAAGEAVEKSLSPSDTRRLLENAAALLNSARPTAVNLKWALEEAETWLDANRDLDNLQIYRGLEELAHKIFEEDIHNNRLIGRYGAALVPHKAGILTHCNAGALATGGYGTALGVVRAAFEAGKEIEVFIDETRPLLQGARITAFELLNAGIKATLITDSAAGYLMAMGKVDIIVVGADRIAANGDAANKIGTYSLAVLARYHGIPFYIAAPLSTIDMKISSGSHIIIEERAASEVLTLGDRAIAPAGMGVLNYAFDITPVKLINGIITEKGVVKQPSKEKLAALFK